MARRSSYIGTAIRPILNKALLQTKLLHGFGRELIDVDQTIDRLFGEIGSAELEEKTSEGERIVVGYRLHNLYNAF